MKTKLFGTVCVLSALAVVACGDDESGEGGSGGSTTTTTATGNNTKSTSTGMGTTKATTTGGMECPLPDTTEPANCDEACSDLYDCGAIMCNGATLCMFSGDAAEKTAFVGGCVEACAGQMALISLINPADCEETITTLSNVNAQFGMTCDNGISGTGGGGGGN